jgi:hypothetical protein
MKFAAKTVFSILVFSLSTQAGEINAQCDVVKLNDGEVFEESLAETGYYEAEERGRVSLYAKNSEGEVFIGESYFTTEEDSAQIVESETSKTKEIRITDAAQNYKIIIYKSSNKGVILFKSAEQPDYTKYTNVAEIDCNDYKAVKRSMVRGETIEKQVKTSRIPKNVLEKISQIDVPFEMADGYYGVKYEKHFTLSLDGKIVGYKLESYLSYTEGEDTMATTYFLANGVRFSGPRE